MILLFIFILKEAISLFLSPSFSVFSFLVELSAFSWLVLSSDNFCNNSNIILFFSSRFISVKRDEKIWKLFLSLIISLNFNFNWLKKSSICSSINFSWSSKVFFIFINEFCISCLFRVIRIIFKHVEILLFLDCRLWEDLASILKLKEASLLIINLSLLFIFEETISKFWFRLEFLSSILFLVKL